MEPTKIETNVKPVGITETNGLPVKPPKKGGIKEYKNDNSSSGIIRNWLVGLVVLTWGGQGIYDRNFNQKEDTTPKIVKDLEIENKLLWERIKKLEEKTNKNPVKE